MFKITAIDRRNNKYIFSSSFIDYSQFYKLKAMFRSFSTSDKTSSGSKTTFSSNSFVIFKRVSSLLSLSSMCLLYVTRNFAKPMAPRILILCFMF
jgi:hypothetical protein